MPLGGSQKLNPSKVQTTFLGYRYPSNSFFYSYNFCRFSSTKPIQDQTMSTSHVQQIFAKSKCLHKSLDDPRLIVQKLLQVLPQHISQLLHVLPSDCVAVGWKPSRSSRSWKWFQTEMSDATRLSFWSPPWAAIMCQGKGTLQFSSWHVESKVIKITVMNKCLQPNKQMTSEWYVWMIPNPLMILWSCLTHTHNVLKSTLRCSCSVCKMQTQVSSFRPHAHWWQPKDSCLLLWHLYDAVCSLLIALHSLLVTFGHWSCDIWIHSSGSGETQTTKCNNWCFSGNC